jgi:hypothetical protein
MVKEKSMYDRGKQHGEQKQGSSNTFEEYSLRGTPSAILVDDVGLVRHINLGSNGFLDGAVKQLFNE